MNSHLIQSHRTTLILLVSFVIGIGFLALGQSQRTGANHKGPIRLVETGSPLDIFATKNCYFCVQSNNEDVYVRGGRLVFIPGDGLLGLQTPTGSFPIKDTIHIPSNASEILVNYQGRVSARLPGDDDAIQVGEITCYRFEAGRTLDYPTSIIAVSEIPAYPEQFGEKYESFVLTGWKIED